MKKILLLLMALYSVPCFAVLSDEAIIPIHYSLVASGGFHFAFSEVKGVNSVSTGPEIGLGVQFERDGYFFTPDVKMIGVFGLDRSPVTLFSFGFTAGGHVMNPALDVFLGVAYRPYVAYKLDPGVIGRAGASFDLGMTGLQLYLEGTYGTYTQTTATEIINFPELGFDVGLQFPFPL